MRIWATVLNLPLQELSAKDQFGKNLHHSKISRKELERSIKKLQKEEWERKGNARLPEKSCQEDFTLEQRQL